MVVARRVIARLMADRTTRPANPDARRTARQARATAITPPVASRPIRTVSSTRRVPDQVVRPAATLLELLEPAVARVRPALTRLHAAADATSGAERALPIAVAALVLVASVVSVMPAVGGETSSPRAGVLAGFDAAGDADPTARLALGAGDRETDPAIAAEDLSLGVDGGAAVSLDILNAPEIPAGSSAPLDENATLLKPVAPETTVDDGSELLRVYTVKSGDTLSAIGKKFGVSTMTLVWSNGMTSKNLHVGQRLYIPPVNGAVVKVEDTDTLASIAKEFGVDPETIVSFNKLDDPTLRIGQLIVIPGGRGIALKPDPTRAPTKLGSSAPSRTYRFAGGRLKWPVPGGYISQRFHYPHMAIDIAAPMGTPVYASAAGTVVFAGWYTNGGGYQVWISHGSGMYTTYNHMMSVAVRAGQQVAKGTRVGRVGMTGNATGPHCHWEVWVGYPWRYTSHRVNPMNYL